VFLIPYHAGLQGGEERQASRASEESNVLLELLRACAVPPDGDV
jgi:hypothetical protein